MKAIILVLILSARSHLVQSQIIIDTMMKVDDKNSIIIRNENDFPAQFNLSINKHFPLSLSDMMASIHQLSICENIPDYVAAWKYVARNTFHTKPLTPESWQHSPTLFINSIGGGFCDDRAAILARLWQEQGYPVQVIGLSGHVVPQVYVNDNWEMYDPDLFLYYQKEDRVLSVNELAINTELILRGPNRGRKYAAFYQSTDDNIVSTEWYLSYNDWTDEFILPPFSELIIFNNKAVPIIMIRLSEKSIGKLKVPFVPVAVSKKSIFSAQYDVNATSKKSFFLFKTSNPISELAIDKVFDETIVYYLVNPLLSVFEKENTIKIESDTKLIIQTANYKLTKKKIKSLKFYKSYKKRHY